MSEPLVILSATAAGIGFLHTLLGPDHYVPFVMMAKTRDWSMAKTSVVTLLCGVGHVAGSILLGLIGIAAGIGLGRLEWTESVHGDVAARLLTGFGLKFVHAKRMARYSHALTGAAILLCGAAIHIGL